MTYQQVQEGTIVLGTIVLPQVYIILYIYTYHCSRCTPCTNSKIVRDDRGRSDGTRSLITITLSNHKLFTTSCMVLKYFYQVGFLQAYANIYTTNYVFLLRCNPFLRPRLCAGSRRSTWWSRSRSRSRNATFCERPTAPLIVSTHFKYSNPVAYRFIYIAYLIIPLINSFIHSFVACALCSCLASLY